MKPVVYRWSVAPLASHLYAVVAHARGWPLVDAKLGETLAEPVQALLRAGVSSQRLLADGLPLAARLGRVRDLAVALRASDAGPASAAPRPDPLLSALERVVGIAERCYPRAAEELKLRTRPLREQWEAYGPGLLSSISRAAPGTPRPAEVTVQAVEPVCGGGGVAHPGYDAVTLEATLVNPLAALPEVLRLAWLLTGHAAGPAGQEPESTGIVPVLAAAEDLGLAALDPETVAQAVRAWCRGSCDTAQARRLIEAWRPRSP
jgi:hypothetical protein